MRKILGYLLLGLGLLILWPVQIGLGIYGVFYIVKTFIDSGTVPGLVSIPIVGVILSVIYLIIYVIITPFNILVASLLEDKKQKLRIQEEEQQISRTYYSEWEMASPEKRAEIEWRKHHWYRFMESGLSPRAADEKARNLDYDFWAGMVYEDDTP